MLYLPSSGSRTYSNSMQNIWLSLLSQPALKDSSLCHKYPDTGMTWHFTHETSWGWQFISIIKFAFRKWSVTQEDTDSSGHQAGNKKACVEYNSIFVKKKERKKEIYMLHAHTHTYVYIHLCVKKSVKVHIRCLQWLCLEAKTAGDLNLLCSFTCLQFLIVVQ